MPVFADIVPSLNDLNGSIWTSNWLFTTWIVFMTICILTIVSIFIVSKKSNKVRKVENN